MAACSSILAQRIARTGESVVCGVAERQTQQAAVTFTLLLLNIYFFEYNILLHEAVFLSFPFLYCISLYE